MSEESKPKKSRAKAPVPKVEKPKSRLAKLKDVPAEDFKNKQLDIFQALLANTDEQREDLSHAVDLWDSIPRYPMTRAKQGELRVNGIYLPTHRSEFQHRGKSYVVQVKPARIKFDRGDGDPKGAWIEYYPSQREELIEYALRKMAIDQGSGFLNVGQGRSGLAFSVKQLRLELEGRGHHFHHSEIVESLDIMNSANLRLIEIGSGNEDEATVEELGEWSQSYLPSLGLSGQKNRDDDTRCFVEFHDLMTASLAKLGYRQYNYGRLMKCKSQLSRWLINQLVLKFTQAGLGEVFKLLFSTVQRDSGLLNYGRPSDAVGALDESLEELKREGFLMSFNKLVERGTRASIVEVTYVLLPSREFAAEQKTANKRLLLDKSPSADS